MLLQEQSLALYAHRSALVYIAHRFTFKYNGNDSAYRSDDHLELVENTY